LTDDFISLENEKYLIGKLKCLCGVDYTSNVEGMMGDYNSCKELNEKYKVYLKNKNINIKELYQTESNVLYLIIFIIFINFSFLY
jgi:hypothetical protein